MLNKNHFYPFVVALLLICSGTAVAEPVVLYNTFGPGDDFSGKDSTSGFAADIGFENGQRVANGFTVSPGLVDITLESIEVALINPLNNAGENQVILMLHNDFEGQPGNVIESFVIDLAPKLSKEIYSVSSVLHPVLYAEQSYWLVASAVQTAAGPITELGWPWNGIEPWGTSTGPALHYSEASGWQDQTQYGQQAFRINASAVPGVPQLSWDPSISWQGCYDSDAIYYSFTSNPPTCESIEFFNKSYLHCDAAAQPLEALGAYQGKLLAWRERLPDRSRWQEIRDIFPERPVECEEDRGMHGEVPGVWYAANYQYGPWSTSPDYQPAWNYTYYIYDGNYLNWLNSSTVAIDVIPGDAANQVFPNRAGKLPVAILSSAEFDATQVDPATLRFGSAEASINDAVTITNVDGLFSDDTVAPFSVEESGIFCNDTVVMLSGSTYAGDGFAGSGTIDASDCEDGGCHVY
jgi:hypothetical protein